MALAYHFGPNLAGGGLHPQATRLDAIVFNRHHPMTGLVNVYFTTIGEETFAFPMHTFGWEAFNDFLTTEKPDGPIYAKVDHLVAKKMGLSPKDVDKDRGSFYVKAYDPEEKAFTIELLDARSMFDVPYSNPAYALAPACLLCPNRTSECRTRTRRSYPSWGDRHALDNSGFYHFQETGMVTVKEQRWYWDTKERRNVYGPIDEEKELPILSRVAPACTNPKMAALRPKLAYDNAKFNNRSMRARLEFDLDYLDRDYHSLVSRRACEHCAGCGSKKFKGCDRPERVDTCFITTPEIVRDVLKWIEADYGLDNFRYLCWMLAQEYMLKDGTKAVWRIFEAKLNEDSFYLKRKNYSAGGYQVTTASSKRLRVVGSITPDGNCGGEPKRCMTTKVFLAYPEKVIVNDQLLAVTYLMLQENYHSHDFLGWGGTLTKDEDDVPVVLELWRFYGNSQDQDKKRAWGWDSAMENWGSSVRDTYERMKKEKTDVSDHR